MLEFRFLYVGLRKTIRTALNWLEKTGNFKLLDQNRHPDNSAKILST